MTSRYRGDVAKGLQEDEYLMNSNWGRCYSIRLRFSILVAEADECVRPYVVSVSRGFDAVHYIA
jgi:hypothetical protein